MRRVLSSLVVAALVVVPGLAEAAGPAHCDFDGDGKSDPTVVRDEAGSLRWWILRSSDFGVVTLPFGTTATDFVLCGDTDGDTLDDVVVYRPGLGFFSRLTGTGGVQVVPMGLAGDTPFLGDVDGDLKEDFIVHRAGTPGVYYAFRSSDATFAIVPWGTTGDFAYVSDRDGDGLVDYSVQRPSTQQHWIRRSSDSGVDVLTWGAGTDLVSPLDYSGDGMADLGALRTAGSARVWYVLTTAGAVSFYGVQFGATPDFFTPSDYDGDGKADIGVWRPATGQWWSIDSATSALRLLTWGASTDTPVISFDVH